MVGGRWWGAGSSRAPAELELREVEGLALLELSRRGWLSWIERDGCVHIIVRASHLGDIHVPVVGRNHDLLFWVQPMKSFSECFNG